MARLLSVVMVGAVWLAAGAGILPASAAHLTVVARPAPYVKTVVCPLPPLPPLVPTVLPCV